MAIPTLAQQLQALTESQAFANLLATYQANGFPTTAWQAGDIDRTRTIAFSKALADLVSIYVPAIAGGSLLDYAPNYPGWTALTAQQIYGVSQNVAVFTQGNVLATNTASVAYTFSAASPLTFVFGSTLNRYFSVGSGTIPASGTLVIPVQAENPGSSYSDANSSASITLVTPLAGVTITNPASTYSAVTHTGSGTGTLSLSGSPVGPHSVLVTVTSTLAGGTSPTVQYTLDGNVVALSAVTAVGITIGFVAGGSGTSWVLGDTFAFTTPGSWITQQGVNTETDAALVTRSRARLANQSNIPVANLYYYLATTAPTFGPQVTQCIVLPDGTINNKVNVIVAGPLGVLPSTVITGLQAYLSPRRRGCDTPVVQSPTSLNVTLAGTITCSASLLSSVQASIQTAMTNLVNAVGINGTIRISSIVEQIMLVSGVIDATSITINGAASNLTLGSSTSFVLPALQALGFTYVTQ